MTDSRARRSEGSIEGADLVNLAQLAWDSSYRDMRTASTVSVSVTSVSSISYHYVRVTVTPCHRCLNDRHDRVKSAYPAVYSMKGRVVASLIGWKILAKILVATLVVTRTTRRVLVESRRIATDGKEPIGSFNSALVQCLPFETPDDDELIYRVKSS